MPHSLWKTAKRYVCVCVCVCLCNTHIKIPLETIGHDLESTHTHSLSLSLTHSLTLARALSLSLTHTATQKHRQKHIHRHTHGTHGTHKMDTKVPLDTIGHDLEHHNFFPERCNVSVVTVSKDKKSIRMRVWERGAGITEACGTGACATLVNAVRRGYIGKEQVPNPCSFLP
jgi:hypothetical protein